MPIISVNGFENLDSNNNPKTIANNQFSQLINMEYQTSGAIYTRRGSKLDKSNSQWSSNAIVAGTTFKKSDDNFYFKVVALEDGRIFYIRNTDETTSSTDSYTEIVSTSDTSPALTANSQINFAAFNNKLFISDGSSDFYWWDNTATTGGGAPKLTKVADPTNFANENVNSLNVYGYRLWAIGDDGVAYYSVINDGTDFTGTGSGEIEYDRVEGLKVSNFIPFSEGAVLVTQDQLTQRFQTTLLTGYKEYDPAVAGSEVGQFKFQRLNSISGIVGRSGQEIGNSIIGLTPRGFITLNTALGGGGEFGLTSQGFLSNPINDLIKRINFSASDAIISTVDYQEGRYLCAVPLGLSEVANTILVYDFRQSKPDAPRWSIFNYSYNGIRALFSVVGTPFLGDQTGNLYETNIDSQYDDNGMAYNCSVQTKAFGGEDLLVEKDFKNVWVNFLVPPETQNVSVFGRLDGTLISRDVDGVLKKIIQVNPKEVENRWDIIGNRWDSGLRWDNSTLPERLINLNDIGGRGVGWQISLGTSSAGANWGMTGLSVQYDNVIGSGGGRRTNG